MLGFLVLAVGFDLLDCLLGSVCWLLLDLVVLLVVWLFGDLCLFCADFTLVWI